MEKSALIVGNTIDTEELSAIAKRTLIETYAGFPPEYLNRYHEQTLSPQNFAHAMNDENVFIAAACVNDKVVGFAKLIFGNRFPAVEATKPVELEKLYVLKDFHGHGYGKKLFECALAETGRRGADVLWLGVQNENANAIRFYQRLGFVRAGEREFTVKLHDSTYTDREIVYSLDLLK